MKYSNLVVTGSLAKDTIFMYEGVFEDSLLPRHLSHLSVSFQSPKIIKSLGGPLLNIAYSISFFLHDKVKLIGAVGKDGQEILDFLEELEMDTSGILFDKNLYTACGSCITDKNKNQIWGFCDGAGSLIKDIDISQYCTKDSLFLISPTNRDSVITLVDQSVKLCIDYIYDVGMHIPVLTSDELQYGINNCKYLIVNEYELDQIKSKTDFDQNIFVSREKILITTMGEKGVKYRDKENEIFVPAYKSNCIDPVGAGDCWRGVFFGELINGKDLQESLIIANVMASFSVESEGGASYNPKKIEIQERFDKIIKIVYY